MINNLNKLIIAGCLVTASTLCNIAHASNVVEICSERTINAGKCEYITSSTSSASGGLVSWWNTETLPRLNGKDCFESYVTSSTTSDSCNLGGICIRNTTDHDDVEYCTTLCDDLGYNITVEDLDTTTGNVSRWACACARDTNFVEWRTYKTGYLRRYKQTAGANCAITATALNEYKCAPGYYGPNNSTTGCKVCPANATCPGGTYFNCNNGYYKNSAGTGCTKCPNSKEGGLGWDANGNGVNAGGGDELEYCAFSSGTVLHDSTGTFTIDPDEETTDGCEYTP